MSVSRAVERLSNLRTYHVTWRWFADRAPMDVRILFASRHLMGDEAVRSARSYARKEWESIQPWEYPGGKVRNFPHMV